MTWVKIDDAFAEHPKIAGLSDRAFRLHVAALCYCGRNLTDGTLDPTAVKVIKVISRASKRHVLELVAADLWIERGARYEIKDFLDYNRSGDQVRADRGKARARMNARRSGERSGEHNGEPSGERSREVRAFVRLPSPVREVLTDKCLADDVLKKLGSERFHALEKLLAVVSKADEGTAGVLVSLCKQLPVRLIDDVRVSYQRGAPAGKVVNALKQKIRDYEQEVMTA